MKKFATRIWCVSLVLFAAFASAADKETIAIIGTGDLGDSFGQSLAKLGYPVVYGSRTPEKEKVQKLVARSGDGASATTQKEAAAQADIIMLAVPWDVTEEVIANLGDTVNGKIIMDATNVLNHLVEVEWATHCITYKITFISWSSRDSHYKCLIS